MYARFIPGEEIGEVSAWRFGSLGPPQPEPLPGPPQPAAAPPSVAPEPAAPPPEPLEVQLQRAWEQGHDAGYAQGHADATRVGHEQLDAYVQGQARAHAERLAGVARDSAQRLQQAEQLMARQVLELATELARQVVRRELATRPDAVLPVVREALDLLGADFKPAVVRLHPDDLQVVGTELRAQYADLPISWIADAEVQVGGCLVESGGSVVDGSLQARWRRAIAQLGLASSWATPDDGTQTAHAHG